MNQFIEEEKGISRIYTPFQQCKNFKDWVLISKEKLKRAKQIIELDYPYHLTDPFSTDKIEKYLCSGVLIEIHEESAPNLKEGWGLRLRCEKVNKPKLEEKLKHLHLID